MTGRWNPKWDQAKVIFILLIKFFNFQQISLLGRYRFELIVQNSLCDFYTDEKLVLALEEGVIPVSYTVIKTN